MEVECIYLGDFTGQKLTVRCRQYGGALRVEPVKECLHIDHKRGRCAGKCISTWGGPWKLPEQAVEAAAVAICDVCPLRRGFGGKATAQIEP